MDAVTSPASVTSSSSNSLLLQALIARGWHFRDLDQIRGLITAQLSIPASICTVDIIESELLNMDLRSIGGKCLPQTAVLCKTSHLEGPIVLQVCSGRDISRSCIADASGNSGNRRLLRLKLTDGHSEITAVERSDMPSIPDDVSPGTKVRLQNRADVCSGILCLNRKVITILGGVVQSLYEEWQLKRKYLDVTGYALRLSQKNSPTCPPPFEKLQIRTPALVIASTVYNCAHEGTNCSSDTTAPKVTASIPVQNQVAAQKLLQKTSVPNFKDDNSRSPRHRGKGKDEDLPLITLDEWERRRTVIDLVKMHEHADISQDEDLARQLQKQFELEDIHAQHGSHLMDAKSIKISMFSFERDAGTCARTGFRGQGRGRGRGRGIGRSGGRVQT
ncbi:hypothetical protein OROHE_008406 [Orobanche hederae]